MTPSSAPQLVAKLWSYCHVLRDDGLSYLDYLEQLTFLLFLKMAEERAALTGEEQPIPPRYRWAKRHTETLASLDREFAVARTGTHARW